MYCNVKSYRFNLNFKTNRIITQFLSNNATSAKITHFNNNSRKQKLFDLLPQDIEPLNLQKIA
jgi:hypothetical protein